MKKIHLTILLFSAFLLSTVIISCLKEDPQNSSDNTFTLKQARAFFENNATNLSFPQWGATTKSSNLINNNIIPQWDRTFTRTTDTSIIFEIPLRSTSRMISSFITKHDSHLHYQSGKNISFLTIEQSDNSQSPFLYVATIITENNKQLPDGTGSLKDFNGYLILSGLDGTPFKTERYLNGEKYSVRISAINVDSIPDGYAFQGFNFAFTQNTKGGGDYNPGEDDDFGWNGWIVCYKCGHVYEGNILEDKGGCPNCGDDLYNGYLVCPKCHKPSDECTCEYNKDRTCSKCGHFKDDCTCDSNNPGTDDGSKCSICGQPTGQCPGHNASTCDICKLPLEKCPGH